MDVAHARYFLAAIGLDADAPQTWQVFADRKGATVRPEHRYSDLATAAPWLAASQRNGAGVFLTVQGTDGKGRRAENVTRIRALFVDCDHGLPDAWHLEPSCVVETSPGKQHAYWSLLFPIDAATFRNAQLRLIAHYDSDAACYDLPRVMRLPGSLHQKAQPLPVRVVHANPWPCYLVEEVVDGIAPLSVVVAPDPEAIAARAAAVRGGMVAGIDVVTLDLARLFADAGLALSGALASHGVAVSCPWERDHTSTTSSTATMVWSAGEGGRALPGFRCLHAHCASRGLADVMRLFRAQLSAYAAPAARPHRSIIRAETLRARRAPTTEARP